MAPGLNENDPLAETGLPTALLETDTDTVTTFAAEGCWPPESEACDPESPDGETEGWEPPPAVAPEPAPPPLPLAVESESAV